MYLICAPTLLPVFTLGKKTSKQFQTAAKVRRLVSVKQVWHLHCYLFTAAPMAWYMLLRPPRSPSRQRMSRYFWISQLNYTAENLKKMTEFNVTQLKITYPFNRQILIFQFFLYDANYKIKGAQLLYAREIGFSRGCSYLSEMKFPRHMFSPLFLLWSGYIFQGIRVWVKF